MLHYLMMFNYLFLLKYPDYKVFSVIKVRVIWDPVKSGELWSSEKSDSFAILFSVA